MSLHRFILSMALLSTTLWAQNTLAQENCANANDRACITASILRDADNIKESAWRDQALRDAAVSMTFDNKIDAAIAQIAKITNPDTKAMTIRGIGMEAALYGKHDNDEMRAIFKKLELAAGTIELPAANAIAHTYIAMAQAFAGLDDDAEKTASAMTNAALKHKAFGESAEIQAERGDITRALASIAKIDATSYRNKSYQTVAEILIKKDMFNEALISAQNIDNPAKRAQTLQRILKAQEDATKGPRNDQL